jgi:hypothetical protein
VQEKRQHRRIHLDSEITCNISNEEPFGARASDISLGGMRVVSERSLPFGTQLAISIEIEPYGKLDLPGTVRWTTADGFGVQFGLLGAKATHAITKLSGH